MRFVRTVGALMLLTLGIPVLLAGGTLWMVAAHRDSGGAFTGSLERLETSGHAVVVSDLDALLRRDVPFVHAGRTRLRITAQTTDGPAFLGVAPTTDVARYLATAPHARLVRVGITRGALPVRLVAATPEQPAVLPTPPGAQTFWRYSAAGALDIDPEQLRGRSVSLVVMRPDGAAGIDADVRVEVRFGWLDPAMWGLLASGILLVTMAAILLTRPIRPREVVFVVEPAQVPVLAARLGVATLDPAQDPTRDPERDPAREATKGSGTPPAQPVKPIEAATSTEAATPAASGAPVASGARAVSGTRAEPPVAGPDRPSVARPADLAEVLRAEHRPTPVPHAAGTPPAPGEASACPTQAHPTPRPFDGRPMPAPQPAWPPPAMDRVGSDAEPKRRTAAPSGPHAVQTGRSQSTGSFRVRAAAPAPAPVTPVQPSVRPLTGPARLRSSVPAGDAGTANTIDLPPVAPLSYANRVRQGERWHGERSGPARSAEGRHHAAAPVLPVRTGGTPATVNERNMGRNRWWDKFRRDRAGGPVERV